MGSDDQDLDDVLADVAKELENPDAPPPTDEKKKEPEKEELKESEPQTDDQKAEAILRELDMEPSFPEPTYLTTGKAPESFDASPPAPPGGSGLIEEAPKKPAAAGVEMTTPDVPDALKDEFAESDFKSDIQGETADAKTPAIDDLETDAAPGAPETGAEDPVSGEETEDLLSGSTEGPSEGVVDEKLDAKLDEGPAESAAPSQKPSGDADAEATSGEFDLGDLSPDEPEPEPPRTDSPETASTDPSPAASPPPDDTAGPEGTDDLPDLSRIDLGDESGETSLPPESGKAAAAAPATKQKTIAGGDLSDEETTSILAAIAKLDPSLKNRAAAVLLDEALPVNEVTTFARFLLTDPANEALEAEIRPLEKTSPEAMSAIEEEAAEEGLVSSETDDWEDKEIARAGRRRTAILMVMGGILGILLLAGAVYLILTPLAADEHYQRAIELAEEGEIQKSLGEFKIGESVWNPGADTLADFGGTLSESGALLEGETFLRRSIANDPERRTYHTLLENLHEQGKDKFLPYIREDLHAVQQDQDDDEFNIWYFNWLKKGSSSFPALFPFQEKFSRANLKKNGDKAYSWGFQLSTLSSPLFQGSKRKELIEKFYKAMSEKEEGPFPYGSYVDYIHYHNEIIWPHRTQSGLPYKQTKNMKLARRRVKSALGPAIRQKSDDYGGFLTQENDDDLRRLLFENARYLMMEADFPRAKKNLEDAMSMKVTTPLLLLDAENLWRLIADDGKFDEHDIPYVKNMVEDSEKLMARAPTHPSPYVFLGHTYFYFYSLWKRNESPTSPLREAYQLYQTAHSLAPSKTDDLTLWNLAWSHHRFGNRSDSRKIYSRLPRAVQTSYPGLMLDAQIDMENRSLTRALAKFGILEETFSKEMRNIHRIVLARPWHRNLIAMQATVFNNLGVAHSLQKRNTEHHKIMAGKYFLKSKEMANWLRKANWKVEVNLAKWEVDHLQSVNTPTLVLPYNSSLEKNRILYMFGSSGKRYVVDRSIPRILDLDAPAIY